MAKQTTIVVIGSLRVKSQVFVPLIVPKQCIFVAVLSLCLFVCLSMASYLAFVLSLFVPHLSSFPSREGRTL